MVVSLSSSSQDWLCCCMLCRKYETSHLARTKPPHRSMSRSFQSKRELGDP